MPHQRRTRAEQRLVAEERLERRLPAEHGAHRQHRVEPVAELAGEALGDEVGREPLLPGAPIPVVTHGRVRHDTGVEPGIPDFRDNCPDVYNPDQADLAYALYSERIDDVVRLVDEDDIDVVHVGVHRHVVFGNIGVHDAAEMVIDQRLLVQRHADAPHHAAHDLAARRLGVEDAPGRDRVDDAGDADHAELFVDLHLGEDRRMGVAGIGAAARRFGIQAVLVEFGGFLFLDTVHAAVPHRLGDRHRAAGILLADNLAVSQDNVAQPGSRQR